MLNSIQHAVMMCHSDITLRFAERRLAPPDVCITLVIVTSAILSALQCTYKMLIRLLCQFDGYGGLQLIWSTYSRLHQPWLLKQHADTNMKRVWSTL